MLRFPTWQMWKQIHSYMSLEMYEMLMGMLRVKRHAGGKEYLSNIWIWVIANLFTNFVSGANAQSLPSSSLWVMLPILAPINFLIPTFITVMSLRYGLKIANSIAKQHEIGNYDLFAVLPAGEFANMLNIARIYRHPMYGTFVNAKMVIAVLVGTLCVAMVTFLLSFSQNPRVLNFEPLAYGVLIIMVRGVATFVDYLQSFVAVTFIAMLLSQRQKRTDARALVVGCFLTLQLVFYILVGGFNVQWANLTFLDTGVSVRGALLLSTIYVLGSSMLFVMLRELINLILWRAVKRRLEA